MFSCQSNETIPGIAVVKVIVIGGGSAGLGIGWRLVQHGADAMVIERGQPGCGASWAAAGMIMAPEAADSEMARRAAILWPGFADEIEQASACPIAYSADGGLEVAKSPQERELFEARAGRLLSGAEACAMEPRLAPDLACALWTAEQSKVDNRALGPALATAFVRAGGSLSLNETVVRFELQHDRIIGVRTPFALHQADVYVIAAGAWSARIEGLPPEALPPVVPVKGEMIALEPPEGETLPRPAIGGNEIYLVAQRGQLIVGATVERKGFDTSVTRTARDWLIDGAVALMPSLEKWSVAEHWAGLRPGSPDDLPIMGPSILDGLFIASGQYRNGILYAPAIAEAMTAMLLGLEIPFDVSAFDPRRFVAADV